MDAVADDSDTDGVLDDAGGAAWAEWADDEVRAHACSDIVIADGSDMLGVL